MQLTNEKCENWKTSPKCHVIVLISSIAKGYRISVRIWVPLTASTYPIMVLNVPKDYVCSLQICHSLSYAKERYLPVYMLNA